MDDYQLGMVVAELCDREAPTDALLRLAAEEGVARVDRVLALVADESRKRLRAGNQHSLFLAEFSDNHYRE
jgi:hypothetical protein